MMRVLAHSHEWLKQYFYNAPWDPGASGIAEWVGPEPRLSTEDAGTSYADILDVNEAYAAVTFAATTQLRDFLKARVQVRVPSGGPVTFYLSVGYESDPIGWDSTGLTEDYFTVTSNDWETHDIDVSLPAADLDNLATNYAPLGLMTAYVDHSSSSTPPYQVGLIQLYTAGARPLRWKQRNDGLGTYGTPAARGRTSMQSTNRGRGIY